MRYTALLFVLLWLPANARQPLLVVSVDGLDQRYLAECDAMGLKIPNLRKLIREGQWSAGVIGVVPTVTWPSHTTLISGVDPAVHGIRGNRRPASEGGDYYWSASFLKARTLLDAAREARLKTAAITWPVTVDAPVDFNLPEYFQRRRGGAMDLRSIESRSSPPNLVARMSGMFPSFAQEWMDDRTRTLATIYLLKAERPDLILLHLVDLDSEQHDNGPFTAESKAMLEYTDELIGKMMEAMPKNGALALVSDHGFERIEKEVNLLALASKKGVSGIRALGGVAIAETPAAADFLRETARDAQYGIGRQIPKEEVTRFAPQYTSASAVYEPAAGFLFSFDTAGGEIFGKPREIGNHGHWPMRYRAVYVLWGAGIRAQKLPEIPLTDISARLASVLELPFKPTSK